MVAVAQLRADVSVTGANTAISQLNTIAVSSDIANASMVALAEQIIASSLVFGGLATAAADVALSLAGTDGALAGADASLAATTAESDAAAIALAAVAASSEAAAVGAESVAASSDVAAASITAVAASSDLASASMSASTAIISGVTNALGTVAIATGIVAVASGKMTGDYEQGLNKVEALTGSSKDEMKQYSDSVLSLATSAGEGPTKLTDALYNVLSASYRGADAINVMNLAVEDSKIGMTSSAVTTDALTNVLRTFNIQSQDITATNGEMLQTVTLGKATFEQYASTIVKSASSASQFGISMETMNAAWSTMTSSGIKAAQASTDFQASLKVMDSGIGTVAKSLHKNGIAFDETKFHTMSYGDQVVYLNSALQIANDKHVKITGATIQASQAISTIASHIGDYNNNLAILSNKQEMAKKTQDAWNITQAGFNVQMDKARAAVDVLMIKLGQSLLPVFGQLLGGITPLITKFSDWISNGDRLGGALQRLGSFITTDIVPAISSMYQNFKKFVDDPVIGNMIKTDLANGFKSMKDAIDSTKPLISWFVTVISTFVHDVLQDEPFGLFVGSLINLKNAILDALKTAIQPLVDAIGATLKDHMISAKDAANDLKMAFINLTSFIDTLATAIEKTNKFLAENSLKAQLVKDGMYGIATAVAAIKIVDLLSKIPALITAFNLWAGGAWSAALGMAAANWEITLIAIGIAIVVGGIILAIQHWGDITKWLQGAWANTVKFFEWVFAGITKWFVGIGQWFHDRFTEASNAITAVFSPIGKWFYERWREITGWFAGIGQWFSVHFTEAYTAVTSVFNSIGKWFFQRFTEAKNAIVTVFDKIGDWFAEKWNAIYTPLKPLINYISQVFQTIWNIIVAVAGKIGHIFAEQWDQVTKIFSMVGSVMKTQFQQGWNAIVTIFGFLGNFFQVEWDTVVKVFSVVGDVLKKQFQQGWDAIVTIFMAFGYFFQKEWEAVVKVFSVVGDVMHKQFQQGWDAVVLVFNVLGHFFQTQWDNVVRIFSPIGEWFKNVFSDAWNKIVIAFAPLANWFKSQWDLLVKDAGILRDDFIGKFNDIKNGVGNIVHDMINITIDRLNDGISAVENFINFFGRGLNNLATAVGAQGTVPKLPPIPRIPHYETGTSSHPGGPMIVGEKGPELLIAPHGTAVLPAAQTRAMLASGHIPGYEGGIGDVLGGIGNWIKDRTSDLIKGLVGTLPKLTLPGNLSSIASGVISTVENWAIDWVKSILPGSKPGGTSGGGADFTPANVSGSLASWIQAAMALTGTGGDWLGPLERIATFESGGDPNAVNNWDINAQEGHPSQGLMQTIPSTFAAYMVAGHGNILNPVDNAAAAINYIKSRYGSVFNVPGILSTSAGGGYVGYANGTSFAPGGVSMVGERGPELMYIPRGAQITPNNQIHNALSPQIVVNPTPIYLDGRLLMSGLMPYFADGVRYQSGNKKY